jgi:hypothetical protein
LSTTNQYRPANPFFNFEYRGFAVEGFGDSFECVRYGRMPSAKLWPFGDRTIFEVGRSGLKIFVRAPKERNAGALEGSGVASRDCETNGERDQRGS